MYAKYQYFCFWTRSRYSNQLLTLNLDQHSNWNSVRPTSRSHTEWMDIHFTGIVNIVVNHEHITMWTNQVKIFRYDTRTPYLYTWPPRKTLFFFFVLLRYKITFIIVSSWSLEEAAYFQVNRPFSPGPTRACVHIFQSVVVGVEGKE